jgi:2-oxoisovalerate dehydrogenase E1 component
MRYCTDQLAFRKNMIEFLEEIKTALLIRRTEEKLLDLFKLGEINGTVHTCLGQEFTGVAVAKYLSSDDYLITNHRGHGHYISRTGDLTGLFAEVMGRKNGCSGGIGGSQHLYHHNLFSNGIQGGMTPIACGLAMAIKSNKKNNIVTIFIGDGTLGEGILYEALNIASIWSLPVLFVVENNEVAQSTCTRQTISGTVSGRATAFDIQYNQCTTNDLVSLFHTADQTIAYVRNQVKPAVLEINTNRLFSHSKGDDNRDPNKIQELKEVDPLNKFSLDFPNEYLNISNAVDVQIEVALSEAYTGEVLHEYPSAPSYADDATAYYPLPTASNKRGNELIFEAFNTAFEVNDRLIMIGEDIETSNEFNPGEYGGAFKVTKSLSTNYPGRIRNTPISEAAIVGVGTGLALAGYRPLVEIMFGDFTTLILDQLLQHACKFRLMYNDKVRVPLIVRTPMGGRRGYGPTHSQSIEKHFLGITDLKVIALNHRIDPANIYSTLISTNSNPALVIENKITYTKKLNADHIPGYSFQSSSEIYPTLRICCASNQPDCTILCYGGILEQVENTLSRLFDEDEILCEVMCPSLINPINIAPIAESVIKTKKLLIVEEGSNISSWGSEVLAILAEKGIRLNKVMRLGNNNIIPCAINAESQVIPGSENIYKAVKKIVL